MYFWIGKEMMKEDAADGDMPSLLQDFIQAVAPGPAADPCRELFQKHAEALAEKPRKTVFGLLPGGTPQSGIERLAELRIRQWVLQKQQENAASRNKMSPKAPGED